ncbi:type II secretion system F family protein [Streptomyces sp. XD-27]|uniref:type II secretion system F family protein n=1 Tax=Streptomyces sp. XD-27 TaxID=3062779 RepID=UPI0026F40A96|nr:type II secretion system F family protein [Streptomyces sp. XD-27]WKX71752.1 type II secretion system F family protein [Streptomyces sp. XD-27]
MSGEVVHRLGAASAVATAVAWLAAVTHRGRQRHVARRRVAAILGRDSGRPTAPHGRWRLHDRLAALRSWLPPAAAMLTMIVLLAGIRGCAAGLAAAYGARRWQRWRRTRTEAKPRTEQPVAPELPLAADLLAACLAAGASPREAAEAVGKSLNGEVGRQLSRAATELRLGGAPAEAWGRVGALAGGDRLAKQLERAGTTGAPAVDEVSRLAADCRAAQERAAAARAGQAQVLSTAPLGLCFLPAFLLLGVVPMVVGLGSGLAATDAW